MLDRRSIKGMDDENDEANDEAKEKVQISEATEDYQDCCQGEKEVSPFDSAEQEKIYPHI